MKMAEQERVEPITERITNTYRNGFDVPFIKQ